MKIDKKALLSDLKKDWKASEIAQGEWIEKVEQYKRETYGLPYGNEQKGKSAIVSKDIKKQLEWMIPQVTDPFLSTTDVIKCNPVTWEDAESARQNELLLNTQFCRKFPRYNFVNKAVRVLATEGTVVVQCSWDYEEEEVEVEAEVVKVNEDGFEYVEVEMVKETIVTKNQPTATVCRNEDIFIDPTCMDDFDKCQFIIHRYETDLSTLKSDGRYKNLDRIQAGRGDDLDFDPEDETEFSFNDKPRQKILVYEYWGNYDIDGDGIVEAIVCTWVGDTIIRLELNPYPDGKPPFIVVPFNPVPFQLVGEALAETIGDNQRIKTAIYRGINDNMSKSNNGQIGVRRGALSPSEKKKWLAGKNFEYDGVPGDIWQGSYNPLPASVFSVLSMQTNEIESQTGVKSFSGGISGDSLGNMLDINTDIPMIDGSFKKLVDVVDGDVLVGSDGRGTTVLKAHEIKFPEVAYDMDFDNGSVVKSGGEHLWTVKVDGTKHSLREWTTMDADEVYKHMQKGRRVTIPAIKEIRTGVPTGNSIDPYVLGFWLGDGMSHSARITTADEEVLGYFDEAGYKCVEAKDSSKCGLANIYDVYKKGTTTQWDEKGYTSNGSFHSELRELGLLSRYGGEKHIPEEYFNATYEEKMELIRGLMDSDGYHHSSAFVQFAQSEGRLKDDFIRLIESLGLKVSIRVRDKDVVNKNKLAQSKRTGSKMIWARKNSYEIGFCPWSNPFKLSRKANNWKPPRKQTVRLKSMKIVDKVLMRCLTVDSEDKLFAVTDKFTLTHNTATSARGAMDAASVRRLSLVRNIAENLMKPLMRKWMAYNYEFLEEEEIVRVTNEEFVPVRRDDLDGKIDIEITISTAEDNAAKSQELSFLLQTLGNTMPFEMTQYVIAEIARLSRMPELEKRIREFKQQPNPIQQQKEQLEMLKLEAEIEKIKTESLARMASANEDELDSMLKFQKARTESARADKLLSERDNLDMKYLKEDEEIDLKHKLALEEYKRAINLESMEFQARHNDRNIGTM